MQPAPRQNNIARNMTVSFFAGLGLWMALLLRASIVLRNEKTAAYDVTCGPFVLNTITRHQDSHGISATINFHPALLYYLMSWLVLGILYAVLRRYVLKPRH